MPCWSSSLALAGGVGGGWPSPSVVLHGGGHLWQMDLITEVLQISLVVYHIKWVLRVLLSSWTVVEAEGWRVRDSSLTRPDLVHPRDQELASASSLQFYLLHRSLPLELRINQLEVSGELFGWLGWNASLCLIHRRTLGAVGSKTNGVEWSHSNTFRGRHFRKVSSVIRASRKISSDKQCPILMDFLRIGIHFASVDITNDKIKMRRTWGLEIWQPP